MGTESLLEERQYQQDSGTGHGSVCYTIPSRLRCLDSDQEPLLLMTDYFCIHTHRDAYSIVVP